MTTTKIGLLVPINNTTMEHELAKFMHGDVEVCLRRIPRGKGTLSKADVPAYKAAAVDLARTFDDDIDVVAYGCTAAGFLSGPSGDSEIAQMLADATGKPVVTTARSMVDTLQEVGANDIAVVTPYREAVNSQLRAFLAESGIRVTRLETFGAETTEELGRIRADEVSARARTTMSDDCHGLFIACSQLPTASILEDLRGTYTVPVWSSISATGHQIEKVLALDTANRNEMRESLS